MVKSTQLPMFRRANPPVSTTPETEALIAADSPVAIGVSGGKDSTAAAFATIAHLDRAGHAGPRLLIHSDLGATEWPQSQEWCEKLAARLGTELVVVRRMKGDMMDRWEQRWTDNVARYVNLECVQLILPWSTPDMRFCTSELKTGVICPALSKRFPGKTILSVTGIRRQESTGRANAPITKPNSRLESVTRETSGLDWHPIADWSLDEVFALHDAVGFPLHPAYTEWGLTRVSCMFCIMQSLADMTAATKFPGSHSLYCRMVALEILSTFAFHGSQWLGDIAPQLVSERERGALIVAKSKAEARRAIEMLVPRDLLYVKGWPIAIPTREAAELLCGVRREVAKIVGLDVRFTEPKALTARYEELWCEARRREKANR